MLGKAEIDHLLEPLNAPVQALSRRCQRIVSYLGSLHWVLQVVLIWLAGRAFTILFLHAIARYQGANPWSPAQPAYLEYINGWDAGYYQQIYEAGYPSELPRDASGEVVRNAFAFLPVFPGIVRGVSSLTGLPWNVAAPTVSMMASVGFFLVAYLLFREKSSPSSALMAIAVLSFATASPVMQFPYAESLGLLLCAALLLLLQRRAFWWAILVVLIAAFTRPLAAPIALTCLIVAALTWWTYRRSGSRLPGRTSVALVGLVVTSLLAVFAWPAVVAVLTGIPNAYFLTESAWRAASGLIPGRYFLASLVSFFGMAVGLVIAAATLALLAIVMLSQPTLRLGVVMWAWTGSMVGYLTAVMPLNSSYTRLAMAAFPFALVLAGLSRSRAYRGLLLISLCVSQIVWLAVFWHWSGAASEPPP